MSHGGLEKFPNRVLATCPGSSAGRLYAGGSEAPESAPLSELPKGRMGGNLAGGAYIGHRNTHAGTSHQANTDRILLGKAMQIVTAL